MSGEKREAEHTLERRDEHLRERYGRQNIGKRLGQSTSILELEDVKLEQGPESKLKQRSRVDSRDRT